MEIPRQIQVHPMAIKNLSKLSYTQARRAMKGWFTHGEQDHLIRLAGCREGNFLYGDIPRPFLIFPVKGSGTSVETV